MPPAPVQVVSDPAAAATALHPIRRQILGLLAEPASATALAKQLGLARQKVNYHLRELESAGFVELVEERRKRNCVERVVRATATSFLVNPEVIASLGDDPASVRDRFSSSHLIAVAARLIRDVATLRRRADRAGKQLPTLSLTTDVRFASAADRDAFTEALTRTAAELAARYHDGSARKGRLYRFVIGAHPVITNDEAERAEDDAPRGDGDDDERT